MTDTRKTVLITGCSSGIGQSLAKEFAARGLHVLATARNAATISDLKGLGIDTFSLEVTKPESIAALHRDVQALIGTKLDILINNAGRNYTVPALHVEYDEVQETFETNVFAVMRMCQTFAPMLIEAKGTIVQIGSVAGLIPYVFGSVYNASKAALHSYTSTLRVELEPFGVKVVTVITGGVLSKIGRTERDLPKDSIYLPIRDEYIYRQTHSQAVGLPSDDYAKRVADQVLPKKPKRWLWEGSRSWIVWFIWSYFPHGFMDIYMKRQFHLWKLPGTNKTKTIK